MKDLLNCIRCGSAGSVEFDMCQVCYYDFSIDEENLIGLQHSGIEEPRVVPTELSSSLSRVLSPNPVEN